jgi:ABC-2 type transport system permease protein
MKTMKWLLQREFWEHKGSMFWAPVVVGAAIVLFVATMVGFGLSQGEIRFKDNVKVQGQSVSQAFNSVPAEKRAQVIDAVANAYLATAAPLYLMLSVVVFFYCLGALYDERRDRSILFWKSLPVSDAQTVLSKVLTALCVAPLITIAMATFTSVLLLIIGGLILAVNGVNLFGDVLSNPAVYLAPLEVLGLLPVYIVWALPTVGWLLMVSAWARSKVFLWAVGAPLIAMVIVKWAEVLFSVDMNLHWFGQHVLARGFVGLFPGVWLPLDHVPTSALLQGDNERVNMAGVFVQSWKSLASPHAYLGALAGGAMIFAAMRLRRWKDEG